MVLVDSRRIARVLRYSGTRYDLSPFRIRGCHPLWPTLPCRSSTDSRRCLWPHDPVLLRFRLIPVRSPLLGESLFDFFSSRYLDVSVPWVGFPQLCIHCGMVGSPYAGCPIRRSPDQSLLAAPRSFSQLSTSFIASHRLSIHRAPFVA